MKLSSQIIKIIFLLVTCTSCSKNNDFVIESMPKMFRNYESVERIKKIDYIIFSFHYEIYDVTIYRVINGKINHNFYFNTLSEFDSISNKSWTQCNDRDSIMNYFPIFYTKLKYRKKVLTDIHNGLLDSKNWYCLIVKEDMNYLFLFTPTNSLLYYIRWNV